MFYEFYIEILIYIILLIGYSIVSLSLTLVVLSVFNKLRYKLRNYIFDENIRPFISVATPAHNEADVIERTIKKFIQTRYPEDKKELIIVNDGSDDDTEKIVRKYAYKIIDSETGLATYKKQIQPLPIAKNIVLVNRKIGGLGKAQVLNDAKKYAQGELIFAIDADIQLHRDSLLRSARHFADDRVGAVIGYISIVDKGDMLTGFINWEFSIGQKIQRVGYDTLGIHYIIPGGCGIFRKSLFKLLGDYSSETLAEDTDMSFRLLTKTKKKVHFDPSINVVADEPIQLKSLWNQRVRWARGNIEVTKKNIRHFGKIKYGKGVTLGYPFWLASVIMPLGFATTTTGFLLMNLLDISMEPFLFVSRIIAGMFIAAITYTIIANKGKYWIQGIISPGFPILITMLSAIIWADGIQGLMETVEYPEYTKAVIITLLLWLMIPMVVTPAVIQLSSRFPKLANFIQLIIFGYWSILIVSGIYAHYKELRGDERVWIKTVR